MSIVFCAVVLQTALLAAHPETAPKTDSSAKEVASATKATLKEESEAEETYVAAHRVTVETGKPLVVMVGADWCGPCQNMRRTILPRVRKDGLFRKVAFAHVNVDRDRELAKELTGGGAVPQLVMFRKTKDGWVRKIMIGSHTVEEVEEFINEGLAQDDEQHKAEEKVSLPQEVANKS
jgi:thioredoxin-like negative regulator of GroEL